MQLGSSSSTELTSTSDLDQTAELILGHAPGGGARDVAEDLHLLHGLDVQVEAGGRGRARGADVHHHQPVH